jgi:hypothetical protein
MNISAFPGALHQLHGRPVPRVRGCENQVVLLPLVVWVGLAAHHHDPEVVHACGVVEVGSRAEVLDGHLHVDADAVSVIVTLAKEAHGLDASSLPRRLQEAGRVQVRDPGLPLGGHHGHVVVRRGVSQPGSLPIEGHGRLRVLLYVYPRLVHQTEVAHGAAVPVPGSIAQ